MPKVLHTMNRRQSKFVRIYLNGAVRRSGNRIAGTWGAERRTERVGEEETEKRKKLGTREGETSRVARGQHRDFPMKFACSESTVWQSKT